MNDGCILCLVLSFPSVLAVICDLTSSLTSVIVHVTTPRVVERIKSPVFNLPPVSPLPFFVIAVEVIWCSAQVGLAKQEYN